MKKLICILLSIALLAGMTACGQTGQTGSGTSGQSSAADAGSKAEGGEESTPEEESVPTGGTLMAGAYILDTYMTNLVPFANTAGSLDNGLFGLVYESLFYYNNKAGALESALGDADTIAWNDDYTEMTVQLNTDAKWHDGEDFTAQDVVFTYELLRDNPTLDEYGMWSRLTGVSADGDDTVVFTCKEPFVSLPNYLANIFIVPEHQWAGQDMATFTNSEPVGTGPFVYDEYVSGTSINYTANKDYWKGAPKVDGMTVVLYNSATNLTLALIAGEIDLSIDNTIVMSSVSEFMAQENAAMDVYAGLGNFCVMMNHENELLADPAVRQAMCMATNVNELAERGEYNCVEPATINWLPDVFGDYVNEEAAASLTCDPEGAQKVLEDAGYTKGSDGIYAKDGKRLSFEYYSASGAPAQQSEAAMIQQYLLDIGIEIVPRVATWAELTSIASEGSYDLLQNSITFPCDVQAALSNSFSTDGSTNYFNYSNPEVDELLQSAVGETDESKLKEIYSEVQAKIAADYVFIPMYNSGYHLAYYEGSYFTGWTTFDSPINSTDNLISIHPVE